jgi:hypothetical protein
MANTILHKSSSRLLQSLKTSQRFSVLPQVPLPLVDADVSSKKYVDDQINFAVVASAAGLMLSNL